MLFGIESLQATVFVPCVGDLSLPCGDHSLCHRAPLHSSLSASLPSSVVGRGLGLVSGGGRVARWAGRVSALCPCCGLDHVGGNDNMCGECLSRALGDGPLNSCIGHGHDVLGGTKTQSTCTRSGVWRPLEGPLSVVDKLALGHRGESEVHVEAREGRTNTYRCGTRLVELGQGREVEVKIPTDPERDQRSPGPGVSLRERWGWKPLLRTLTSGIWVLPGALEGVGLGDALASAAGWVGRGTYRTSWAGTSIVRLPMLVFVRARPSYRATNWTADFSDVV